jgi:hypothetical protein
MLRIFPEIEFFFKQSYFTQDDLIAFKEELAIKYISKEESKKAMSLVDLFLLKFKLSTPKELEEFKSSKAKNLKGAIEKSKRVKINSNEVKSITTVLIVKSYREIVIRKILRKLNITTDDLNIELSRNNVQLITNTNNYFSHRQFDALNIFLEDIVEHLIRHPSKKEIVKQPKQLKITLNFEDRFLKLTLNKPLLKFKNVLGLTNAELTETLCLSDNIDLKKELFTEGMWQQNNIKIEQFLEKIKEKNNYTRIKKRKKTLSSGGVYDEISRRGGIGKVIFIRTR